jgi:GNAT superfamily N-acetyltransferase
VRNEPSSIATDGFSVQRPDTVSDRHVEGLADVLIDCVDGGASVSFMHPLPVAKAQDFWHRVAEGVTRGKRALLVAQDAVGVVGTVHLILHQPENQPHRADLSKMLVHRRARRRGLGAALLRAAEDLGRERCGVIPDYALLPRGGFCDTAYFYRRLDARPT